MLDAGVARAEDIECAKEMRQGYGSLLRSPSWTWIGERSARFSASVLSN
jgi:hypothetical protein